MRVLRWPKRIRFDASRSERLEQVRLLVHRCPPLRFPTCERLRSFQCCFTASRQKETNDQKSVLRLCRAWQRPAPFIEMQIDCAVVGVAKDGQVQTAPEADRALEALTIR